MRQERVGVDVPLPWFDPDIAGLVDGLVGVVRYRWWRASSSGVVLLALCGVVRKRREGRRSRLVWLVLPFAAVPFAIFFGGFGFGFGTLVPLSINPLAARARAKTRN